MRRRNMILVVLAAVLAAVTPANAAASVRPIAASSPAAGANVRPAESVNGPDDVTTTVDFEAYAPGTEITNQYAGITFEYPTSANFTYGTPGDGVVSSDVGAPPTVVASGAHSGKNAGEMVPAGEFGGVGTFAVFSNLADAVSVYIGNIDSTSIHVELDAYGSNRDLLGSDTAVTSGAGAQTLLSYTAGGAGPIAYVAIYRTDVLDSDAVIDDLSFDVPPATAPIVGVSTSATSYELGQGGSRALALTVTRIDNAANPVTIAVAGLPAGVTSTLSENPVSLPDQVSTLTLTASTGASPGNYQVTLSASSTGAASQAPAVITLSIIAPVQVVVPSSLQVGACATHPTTIEAQVAPGLSGPVTFATGTTSSSSGLSASVSPVQAAVTNGLAQTTLTVGSTGGAGSGMVEIIATLPSGGSNTVELPIQQLGPQVTSVDAVDTSTFGTPVAGLLAKTPRAGRPGTTVEISGQYFCSQATVAFGNSDATVTATVQHESGLQGPYDYLRVTTPRSATSGPVTVTAGSPTASGSSSSSLTVDSYRNTDAFNFQNFDPVLTFQDLTDAFGEKQTYINVNVCGFLTLGLAQCSVAIVPDPVALALLLIAQKTMATGTCFGFSLTDQRLLSGQLDLTSFPRTGDLIYDLDGPAVDSTGTARGNEPVLVQLKASHLMQLSTEFLESWSTHALNQDISRSNDVAPEIAQEIDNIFAAGRYPMIEIDDTNSGGGGHVLVAYDMVATGTGGYDIYVYDSNNPYTSGENSSDGTAHAAAVASSVIHLQSDGDWSLASTVESGSSTPYNGGQGSIIVTDPATIPLHPTLGTLGGVAPNLLFSSGGAPGSAGASGPAAGRVTQVSAAGKTLYSKSGTLNADRATRLDAAPFAPFVGPSAKAARTPQLTVVGPGVNQIAVATTGTGSGAIAETFVGGGSVESVDASTHKGTHQDISFSPATGAVGFSGPNSTPLMLAVDRVTTGGSYSATVTSSSIKGGSDSLSLTPGGNIVLSRGGPAATFTVALSGEVHNGLPATFTSRPISIGSGQSARLSGIRWSALAASSATLTVGGRHLQLRNLSTAVHLVTISKLRVVPRAHRHVSLVVIGDLSKVPGSTMAAIVWVVHRGKRALARHEVVLAVGHGPFTSSWTVLIAKAKGDTFTAEVVAVASEGTSEESGTTARSVTFSVG